MAKISVGHSYLFVSDEDVAIEWMVTRIKARDRVVMLVPVDDVTTFVGSADVDVESIVGRPAVVRAGHAVWVPARGLRGRMKTDPLPREVVTAARRQIAALVRGPLEASLEQCEVDADPAYDELDAILTRSALHVQFLTLFAK